MLVGLLLALAPGAQARPADAGNLVVVFHTGQPRITVTLANGTPVGTTSGAPTVIPPGPYNIAMDDSAGAEGPKFDVRGPGVSFADDMFLGETPTANYSVTFEPSSTYTWRNDEQPSVVFTFATSASGGGTTQPAAPVTTSGSGGKTTTTSSSSTDIVGSSILQFRGTLIGNVSGAGVLTLTFDGKKVSGLKAGRYTVRVIDSSKKAGFTIRRAGHAAIPITVKAFVGTHAQIVSVPAGQWLAYAGVGKTLYFFVTA